MRPVVVIVSARPETIADDYRRLFELAGISANENNRDPVVAMQSCGAGYEAGRACTPWQIDALLKMLSPVRGAEDFNPLLVPVENSGPVARSKNQGWKNVLERHQVSLARAEQIESAPFRPASLLPSLEAVQPQGFKISPHLRGKNLFLMSGFRLDAGGVPGAQISLLASLLAADRKMGGKIPKAEVLAEVMGLAREVFPSIWAVTDATVVSVVRRGGARVPLVRNLLLAGNDPIAMDSVLIRLAGLDPADSPWLHLGSERDFGVSDLAGIRLLGEPEWLDLDFQIPEDTFATGNRVKKITSSGLLNKMAGKSSPEETPSPEIAWARLFRDFQSGEIS